MTLPPPNLDTRNFDSLVEEARARIPTFTGELTDLNDSDPGMTLVQLHAWLTETLLYQVNRLPDLAYVNFLNLLGTTPAPARAAQSELSFKFANLDKVDDPLTILVPRRTQVAVDDPNLTQAITFETDNSLRGINAAVASIIISDDNPLSRKLVGDYNVDEATLEITKAFRPFGSATVPVDPDVTAPEMKIGLLLRPIRKTGEDYFLDRFPEGELDLSFLTPQVFDQNADAETIDGPFGSECLFPWQIAESGRNIVWEAYTGTTPATDFDAPESWTELRLRGDETAGLERSGHLYLDIPPNLPAVDFGALPREGFWQELELSKPPENNAQLVADLDDGVFVAADLPLNVWKDQLGLTDPPLQNLVALTTAIEAGSELDFASVDEQEWTDLGYSEAPVPFALYWIRARLVETIEIAPQVNHVLLNSTRATAATSRTTEVLGTSAGRPNQVFKLKRAPVLIDPVTGEPDIEIELVDPTGERREIWQRGDDFFGAGRDTTRYLLDPKSGEVRFGDGVNGMIPVAGTRVQTLGYRVGGGRAGNVAAGTISVLKTALPQVQEVANLRRATGGSDAESLQEAKLRAPQLLRTRDRAVSADDFADLALRTPGVDLKSAYSLPLTRLGIPVAENLPRPLIDNSPGAVTVVVLPVNNEPTPQPSEEQLRLICAWLNERRLITTELYVTGPRYINVSQLDVEILASADADLKHVQDRCVAALRQYLHPLTGGTPDELTGDGPGWPIGGDIYLGNVFDHLLSQQGVARVADLKLSLEGQPNDDCADVLEVPEGTLVHLPPTVLDVQVRYARGA